LLLAASYSLVPRWQSAGEKTGVNSVLGIRPTTADFVKDRHFRHVRNTVKQARAGQGQRGPKKFCLADAHRPHQDLDRTQGPGTSGKVKAEVPVALDTSHQSKLDKLKDKSGKDFSSDFASMQVSAHKDAVSLFERYAKGDENADLKDWAGKTRSVLKHHLAMAQGRFPLGMGHRVDAWLFSV
jgi:putative membrane protein